MKGYRRWMYGVSFALAAVNMVLGHLTEGLEMVAVCVAADIGFSWLDVTGHQLRSRLSNILSEVDAVEHEVAKILAKEDQKGPQ